jgi:hypothetical protein
MSENCQVTFERFLQLHKMMEYIGADHFYTMEGMMYGLKIIINKTECKLIKNNVSKECFYMENII